MAAASDKARFFLEQSVPELKEYERKKIFGADEITSIARKRSDFEHKINARGSTPTDYARYAEFEINVDALRRKRIKRLGVKTTHHHGPRRIFFIFDRATRKHPGDVGLWMQSIDYARKQKAHKKLSQLFTNVLRLHPTKPDLWIYAAQLAMDDHGDMSEARSYMQRGLRFCRGTRAMWLEYARLEMAYIAKIHARREILGISRQKEPEDVPEQPQEEDENVLPLPRLTAEDINPDVGEDRADDVALRHLDSTPAWSGAIPIAIFDAAMSHFKQDSALGYSFFEMISEFDQCPLASTRILTHIDQALMDTCPRSWQAQACHIQLPTFNIPASSPEFPSAFRKALRRLKEGRSMTDGEAPLCEWARSWLQRVLEVPDVDPGISAVAESVLKSLG